MVCRFIVRQHLRSSIRSATRLQNRTEFARDNSPGRQPDAIAGRSAPWYRTNCKRCHHAQHGFPIVFTASICRDTVVLPAISGWHVASFSARIFVLVAALVLALLWRPTPEAHLLPGETQTDTLRF
jgi:hypothetical protein